MEGIPEKRRPWLVVNYMKWGLMCLLAPRGFRGRTRHDIGGPAAFIGPINTSQNPLLAVSADLEGMRMRTLDSCEVLFHIGGATK
jgi:hypothetical protein